MIDSEIETPATETGQQRSVADPRPKFSRLSNNRQLALKQMAARIKFLIEFYSDDGRSLRMQEIKRGLHAYRYLEFDDAMKLLEKRRQIVIRPEQSRSRPVFRVVLKQNTRAKLPDPFIFHRKSRKKRKAPPTRWFLNNRAAMDAGEHSGFANVEPWSESAYWLEKERMNDQGKPTE